MRNVRRGKCYKNNKKKSRIKGNEGVWSGGGLQF